MAKVQTVDWKSFMAGDVVEKKTNSVTEGITGKKLLNIGLAVLGGVTFAMHTLPAIAAASGVGSVAVLAADPTFQTQIAAATRPIKDIIFGFAGEIYFIFMAWGALEALIGKPQQGFTRMKTATGSYILLYWVPWIVGQVNKVRPVVGW